MDARMKLKDEYIIAKCCRPEQSDVIVGYYSHANLIKVHKEGCANLNKTDPERLLKLEWADILEQPDPVPDDNIDLLDEIDFRILHHHGIMGVDYSLKVAAALHLAKQTVFDRHAKLRDMGLLERVKPRIIQYRKKIVKGKWIKHRNHTYYDLTEKGRLYLRQGISNI
jgi:hypothetical protein